MKSTCPHKLLYTVLHNLNNYNYDLAAQKSQITAIMT